MPSVSTVYLGAGSDLRAVNELFVMSGLGPIVTEQPDQQIVALYADGELVGALHACAPVVVAYSLVQAGMGVEEAAEAAGRIQAIEALAVAREHRGAGYGALLIDKASEHARVQFFSETLLAKIDGSDPELIDWYARRGFSVCAPGQALQVNGVSLPLSPEHRDAWKSLSTDS
ncbi:GNAT family N-acetyltransferase [Microbacterium sp. NPDC058389]|uniref:GNAT family N-acetyltransferase n=1 Tax=Microbacterium sp. NPDC058389 TaxID=3346475 RepID=UPI00364AB5DE